MPDPWVEATIPCPRELEECPGIAEPEDDGETRWLECGLCGYQTGWQRVPQAEDACALGVPEEARRALGTQQAAPQPSSGPVFLGIGKRPQ